MQLSSLKKNDDSLCQYADSHLPTPWCMNSKHPVGLFTKDENQVNNLS